jgi:hypothetical protein
MVPRAAREQYDAQQRISGVAVAAVRRLWRRMKGRRWETAWRDDVGPGVVKVLDAAQVAAAARSAQYVAEVLAELELQVEADTSLMVEAFAGAAGDGRPVETLAYGAVITAAKGQYDSTIADLGPTGAVNEALRQAEEFLAEITHTILADTARAAETAAIAQRPWLTGYIRMIEPGACSRCAVLAGKFYLNNDGFLRHPRCRCVHIPFAEDRPEDPRTNPSAYFDSLSRADQDRIFTTAGAEAIRLGADPSQVVNARRGMTTAQQNPRGWIPKGRLIPTDVNGKPVFITTEGVTRRGLGRKAMGSGRPVRLMPESIVALGQDAADVIRLLKLYGYIA